MKCKVCEDGSLSLTIPNGMVCCDTCDFIDDYSEEKYAPISDSFPKGYE